MTCLLVNFYAADAPTILVGSPLPGSSGCANKVGAESTPGECRENIFHGKFGLSNGKLPASHRNMLVVRITGLAFIPEEKIQVPLFSSFCCRMFKDKLPIVSEAAGCYWPDATGSSNCRVSGVRARSAQSRRRHVVQIPGCLLSRSGMLPESLWFGPSFLSLLCLYFLSVTKLVYFKMNKNVLFIQGGGGKEDYEADAKLVTSLREALGKAYTVRYPLLSDESSPDFGRKKQIGKEISLIKGEIILVGHSLGASMLLKYLSESRVQKKVAGIFLIATPFWSGGEDWKQGLKLHEDFHDKLPNNVPIFLYHCRDDEVVPFDHLFLYAKKLLQATVREIASGGHQLNNDLSPIAKDIKSL
jgi:hypothetical protein